MTPLPTHLVYCHIPGSGGARARDCHRGDYWSCLDWIKEQRDSGDQRNYYVKSTHATLKELLEVSLEDAA